MNNHFIPHLSLGLSFLTDAKKGNAKMKEKAIEEYKAALKMPRKKKKKAKKSALLLYSVACWGDTLFDF